MAWCGTGRACVMLAAAAATRGRAGVMWMEKPGEFWEVRFQTVVLEEQSEDADCAG